MARHITLRLDVDIDDMRSITAEVTQHVNDGRNPITWRYDGKGKLQPWDAAALCDVVSKQAHMWLCRYSDLGDQLELPLP